MSATNYTKMTEKEMLDCLNYVRDNLSHYGDREIYENIFLVVSDIYTFCTYDLGLDIVECHLKHTPPVKIKEGDFVF